MNLIPIDIFHKICPEKINYLYWTKESLENCAFILEYLCTNNIDIINNTNNVNNTIIKIRQCIKNYFLWVSSQKEPPTYLIQLGYDFLARLQNM